MGLFVINLILFNINSTTTVFFQFNFEHGVRLQKILNKICVSKVHVWERQLGICSVKIIYIICIRGYMPL